MRFDADLNARESRQLERVSKLVQARRALPGLRSARTRTLMADEQLLATARGDGDDLVIVVLNRSDRPWSGHIPVPVDVLDEGKRVRDALGDDTATVIRAAFEAELGPRGVAYFAVES